jgi:hypothetical protein
MVWAISEHTGEPIYDENKIDDVTLDKELAEFISRFQGFVAFLNLESSYASSVKISRYVLIDIIIRVHKRVAYYAYFHGIELSERKTAGLYAYWILKLRPIYVTLESIADEKFASELNEKFAIYHICAMLFFSNQLKKYREIIELPYYNTMLYAFHFRNISIDSMMLLVESINEETFERKDAEVV